MNAEVFGLICNGIVFISALLIAIKNIAEMLGKPIKFFKKKTEDGLEARVKEIVREMMPDILTEHDLETRKKYLADRQKYLEDIKQEVLTCISGQLQTVDRLTDQYKALEISAKDVLREKIVAIYEDNKDTKRLRYFEKRALDQYYLDYKAMKGNSYIDLIYGRMMTWEVEPDDYV